MSEKLFRSELKKIFIDYRKMNSQKESSLRRLDIYVVRKHKHVILYINGKYGTSTVSISSTGSDKREGLNIVSKITRAKYY